MKISLAPDVFVNASIRHGAPSGKKMNGFHELGSGSSDILNIRERATKNKN